MKRSKQIILTLLVTLVLVSLSWYAGRTRSHDQTTSVVMVNQPIQAGQQISTAHLAMIDVRVNQPDDGWITSFMDADQMFSLTELSPGELLLHRHVSKYPDGILYPNAAAGRRLMTIALDPADANGFWLADGSLIDLYLIPKSSSPDTATDVMQSVRIMKVMNPDSGDGSTASSIRSPLLCLDLSLEQADRLSSAIETCRLRLSVINEDQNSG